MSERKAKLMAITVVLAALFIALSGCNVEAERLVPLNGIYITTMPLRTEYFVGDFLNLSGMVVTGVYIDGTSEEITRYTVHGFDSSQPGTVTVTVVYRDKTYSFEVTVAELEIVEEEWINWLEYWGFSSPSEIIIPGDAVTIVLDNETSMSSRYFQPEDFPEIAIDRVVDLTRLSGEIIQLKLEAERTGDFSAVNRWFGSGWHLNRNTFRRILRLELTNQSKENALAAVQLFEQRQGVLYAEPIGARNFLFPAGGLRDRVNHPGISWEIIRTIQKDFVNRYDPHRLPYHVLITFFGGVYNGYVAIVIGNSGGGAITREIVGGIDFVYPSTHSFIRLWKNGNFYRLKELYYEQGKLTQEDLQSISHYHRDQFGPSGDTYAKE